MAIIYRIPVHKAGKDIFAEVDIDRVLGEASQPDSPWGRVIAAGLEVIINEGKTGKAFTGITKLSDAERAKVHESSLQLTYTNVEALYSGAPTKAKKSKTKASADGLNLTGKERTRAMQIARGKVKDAIRAAKLKLADYPAKDISEFAAKLLVSNPEIIEQAKAELAAAENLHPIGLDVSALSADPAKVAKRLAEEQAKAAEKANAPISAKQAGKSKPIAAKTKPVSISPTDSLLAALRSERSGSEAHTAH